MGIFFGESVESSFKVVAKMKYNLKRTLSLKTKNVYFQFQVWFLSRPSSFEKGTIFLSMIYSKIKVASGIVNFSKVPHGLIFVVLISFCFIYLFSLPQISPSAPQIAIISKYFLPNAY